MRCAVLGDPIAHSLSPVLHRAGYAALGLDWTYDAVRVPAGGLRALLATTDATWRGLSLTMPLKREAMELADQVSARAALVGAANTLVLVDGEVHADNTDLPGAVAALREAGLFKLFLPPDLGGAAMALPDAVDVVARIAEACLALPEVAEALVIETVTRNDDEVRDNLAVFLRRLGTAPAPRRRRDVRLLRHRL